MRLQSKNSGGSGHHRAVTPRRAHKKIQSGQTNAAKKANASGAGSAGGVTGGSILAALQSDPTAYNDLLQSLQSSLLASGLATTLVAAIEQVAGATQAKGPGQLLAGTVSTNAGAIQTATTGVPEVAMVFLGGAATAVACYVPPHVAADIATGQEVWVMPINGSMTDLMIVAIRNYQAAPQARINNLWLLASPAPVTATWPAGGASTTITFAGNYGVPSNATGVLLLFQFSIGVNSQCSAVWYPGNTTSVQYAWNLGYLYISGNFIAGQGLVPLSGGQATVRANGATFTNVGCYLVGYTL